MKITRLKIQNFLGIRHVDLPLGEINLVCGVNGSGKSSLQNAIRLGFTGSLPRISLKKHMDALVNDAGKQAEILIEGDPGASVTIDRNSKAKGLMSPDDAPWWAHALTDMHYLASLNATELRQALFNAVGNVTTDEIEKRLKAGGADMALVEKIKALLVNFEAAEKEAEARAKAARAEWKGITGETYGEVKAEGWEYDPGPKVEDLRKLAGEYAKRAEFANVAFDEVEKQEAIVARLKAELAVAESTFTCRECGAVNEPDKEGGSQVAHNLKEHEPALEFVRKAYANRKRDLEEADMAARELKILEDGAQTVTERAGAAHELAKGWTSIKALLSPDGIPAQLLDPALSEINARTLASAQITGWGQVQIHADMEITYGGRSLALCSESERWRADAMLCEAVAYVTGECFLLFDRVDVLGVEQRAVLLNWADDLAQDGHQVVLCSTLKSKPQLDGINVWWLKNGETA